MKSPVSIGDLRQRVTFQRLTHTRDTNGGVIEGWTDVATVSAKVGPLRGGESVQAARLGGDQTFEIVVRSHEVIRSLTSADRVILKGGLKLNIAWSANWDERDRFLTIIASAGNPADE